MTRPDSAAPFYPASDALVALVRLLARQAAAEARAAETAEPVDNARGAELPVEARK